MQRIRVLVDDQIFRLQNRGGISRYFAELVAACDSQPDLAVDLTIPVRYTANVHLQHAGLSRPLRLTGGPREAEFIRRLRNRTVRRLPQDWPEYDLLHHSFYLPEVLAASPGATRVVTVHDMIPESRPDWFPDEDPHAAKDKHVAAASAIICISEFTRQELLRLWGPLPQPVVVIPDAAGPEFQPEGPSWNPGGRFVLFVGKRSGYKDFACLAEAFATVADKHPDLLLVVVGGGPLSADERTSLAELGITRRVRHYFPSAVELACMYRSSTVFVFPSRMEGFGLPVLEALASGTPTILADTPVFREVADTAATYFVPGDATSLSTTIEKVIADGSEAHRRTGINRSADFSWNRTARETAQAYRLALEYAGGQHAP